MKKYLLFLLFITAKITNAQVVSIVPNQGNYGVTLTTTITLTSGVINIGSAPMQLNDIYLKNGNQYIYSSAYTLYPIAPFGFADSLSATFAIPPVCPAGLYDVHVITTTSLPFQTPVDNVLPSGFSIGHLAGYISGIVYFDANQNGIRDTGEVGMPNQLIFDSTVNQTFINTNLTDGNGYYVIGSDTGIQKISLSVPPFYTLTSSPGQYLISLPPDSSGNDFGLYAMPSFFYTQDFSLYTHPMRCMSPGYSAWYVNNTSNLIQNGTITVIYSTNLTYHASSNPPNTMSGDTLRWNYHLNAYGHTAADVQYMNPAAGDTVSYVVIDSVFDNTGIFMRVYSDSYTFIVSCSVDPNDKSVTPPGENTLHHTLKDSALTYTIRFQNTGNDTAYNVIILDTLDQNMDPLSIQILGSSDTVSLQMDAHGALRFSFNNILLPDSNIDEPNSHGYVIYRVHPKPNLNDGTQIHNTAFIYFDFNAAVITNTTLNTYVTQIPVAVNEIQSHSMSFVYPDPVTNSSTLVIPGSSEYELRIFDNIGRQIMIRNVSENYTLMKSKFSPGIYHYSLIGKNGTSITNGKFVIAN